MNRSSKTRRGKRAIKNPQDPQIVVEAATDGSTTGEDAVVDEETRIDVAATEEARQLMEVGAPPQLPPGKAKHQPPPGFVDSDKAAPTRGRLRRD